MTLAKAKNGNLSLFSKLLTGLYIKGFSFRGLFNGQLTVLGLFLIQFQTKANFAFKKFSVFIGGNTYSCNGDGKKKLNLPKELF